MQASASNIHIYAYPAKVAGTCVTVGWEVEGVDPWVLDSLRYGSPLYSTTHLDMTCSLYAVYVGIRDKLLGGALEAVKNKVHGVECGAQGSDFIITVKCNHAHSVVKKALSAVVKNLSTGPAYGRYLHAMNRIGQQGDKQAYQYCAAAIQRSVSKSIRCVVTGKSRFDADSLQLVVTQVAKKYVALEQPLLGARRTHSVSAVRSPYKSVAAGSSLESIVYKKYIESLTHDTVLLVNGRIYMRHDAGKISHGGVETFVDRLGKLGDDARRSMMYLAAAENSISIEELIRGDVKKFTLDDVKRYLVAMIRHVQ